MAASNLTRIGYLDFLAQPLRSLPNAVVVTGKEHVLADEVVKTIVEAALPDESSRALNLDIVDALTLDDPSLLAEKLGSLPFLADCRMLIVRNTIELKNDERIALRDALPETNDQAKLVIDDSGEPKPIRGKAPKDKVDSKDFAGSQDGALLVDCTLDADDRERYIERYAKVLDVQVDVGARRYLAAFESVYEIKNALERLSLVAKRITRAAAEEYVRPPGDPRLWDLGNAVGRGDVHAALAVEREILQADGGVPGPLIWLAGDAQIAWELTHGATPRSWSAATGQSAFRAMKLWDSARRRSKQNARDNVRLTMKALEDSLSGKRIGEQALEEVIIRLCTPLKGRDQ